MQSAITGESIDFLQMFRTRIIDKELDTLTVFCGKVFLHSFKTFLHTFTNGNTGHYYDKLIPAIQLVQLIHRLDVCISLTGTGLHFNGEHRV